MNELVDGAWAADADASYTDVGARYWDWDWDWDANADAIGNALVVAVVVVAVFFAGAGLLPALAVPARLRDPLELLDVELVPPALELEAAVVDGGGGGGMVLRWKPLDEVCFCGGGVL